MEEMLKNIAIEDIARVLWRAFNKTTAKKILKTPEAFEEWVKKTIEYHAQAKGLEEEVQSLQYKLRRAEEAMEEARRVIRKNCYIPVSMRDVPIGQPLEVTVWNSETNTKEVRFPVVYRRYFFKEEYGYFLHGKEEEALPPELKVLAFRLIGNTWEGNPDAEIRAQAEKKAERERNKMEVERRRYAHY